MSAIVVGSLLVVYLWMRFFSDSKYQEFLKSADAIKLKREVFMYSIGFLFLVPLLFIRWPRNFISSKVFATAIVLGFVIPPILLSFLALKKRGVSLFGPNNGEKLITRGGWIFIILAIVSVIFLSLLIYFAVMNKV